MTDKKKALLIEDDKATGQALTHLLEREGLNVIHIRKGEQALETAMDEKPDVILLDLKLAGAKDGFSVLGELKRHPMLASVPVLIVTNYGMLQDVQKGMAGGAAEYLVKADHSIHDIVQKALSYALKRTEK